MRFLMGFLIRFPMGFLMGFLIRFPMGFLMGFLMIGFFRDQIERIFRKRPMRENMRVWHALR